MRTLLALSGLVVATPLLAYGAVPPHSPSHKPSRTAAYVRSRQAQKIHMQQMRRRQVQIRRQQVEANQAPQSRPVIAHIAGQLALPDGSKGSDAHLYASWLTNQGDTAFQKNYGRPGWHVPPGDQSSRQRHEYPCLCAGTGRRVAPIEPGEQRGEPPESEIGKGRHIGRASDTR